ncbi:MAG: hypothetical protein LBS15_00165 [Endomicrobium sp.]|nr:hypothetical protein [Endomicrobium sp.]
MKILIYSKSSCENVKNKKVKFNEEVFKISFEDSKRSLTVSADGVVKFAIKRWFSIWEDGL